jgi:transcriptional regulator with XRE-family HTH domain
MSMADFGTLLGITHAQVSRYESGRSLPGYIALGRLLQLAEGVEKNPVLDHLSELLGKKLTAAEAREELRRMNYYTEPLWGSLPVTPPADPKIWDEFKQLTPNLAGILKATDELCTRGHEVDPSLPLFLQLWLTSRTSDPEVRRCFAEAAQYLEFRLSKAQA